MYDVEEATSTAFEIILEHKVDHPFFPLFVVSWVICTFNYRCFTISLYLPDDQIKNTGFASKISSTFGRSSSLQEVRKINPFFIPHYTFPSILFHCFTLDTCIRCRKGSAEVLVNFDDLYPLDILAADRQGDQDVQAALQKFQICGKDVPRGYWVGIQKGCIWQEKQKKRFLNI